MSEWVIGFGIALVVIGLVLLSPLGDLLPVDFWRTVSSMFSASSKYMRVVPGEENNLPKFALVAIGLATVACGFYLKAGK